MTSVAEILLLCAQRNGTPIDEHAAHVIAMELDGRLVDQSLRTISTADELRFVAVSTLRLVYDGTLPIDAEMLSKWTVAGEQACRSLGNNPRFRFDDIVRAMIATPE
jgi:hypothetical protein